MGQLQFGCQTSTSVSHPNTDGKDSGFTGNPDEACFSSTNLTNLVKRRRDSLQVLFHNHDDEVTFARELNDKHVALTNHNCTAWYQPNDDFVALCIPTNHGLSLKDDESMKFRIEENENSEYQKPLIAIGLVDEKFGLESHNEMTHEDLCHVCMYRSDGTIFNHTTKHKTVTSWFAAKGFTYGDIVHMRVTMKDQNITLVKFFVNDTQHVVLRTDLATHVIPAVVLFHPGDRVTIL